MGHKNYYAYSAGFMLDKSHYFSDIQKKLIIQKVKYDWSAKEYILRYAQYGDNPFRKFYSKIQRINKNDKEEELAIKNALKATKKSGTVTMIHSKGSVDIHRWVEDNKNALIKDKTFKAKATLSTINTLSSSYTKELERIIGTDAHILSFNLGQPEDVLWCKYYLQKYYGYIPYYDSLTIDNIEYQFVSTTFNLISNNYTVLLQKKNSEETTKFFVPNYLDTQYTTVTYYTGSESNISKIQYFIEPTESLPAYSFHNVSEDYEILPAIPIRKDKHYISTFKANLDVDCGSNNPFEYQMTKMLLNALGNDVDNLCEEMNKEEGEGSDIREIYLALGVPFTSKTPDDSPDYQEPQALSKLLYFTFHRFLQYATPSTQIIYRPEMYLCNPTCYIDHHQGDYESSFRFIPMQPRLMEGRIGNTGTYKHTAEDITYHRIYEFTFKIDGYHRGWRNTYTITETDEDGRTIEHTETKYIPPKPYGKCIVTQYILAEPAVYDTSYIDEDKAESIDMNTNAVEGAESDNTPLWGQYYKHFLYTLYTKGLRITNLKIGEYALPKNAYVEFAHPIDKPISELVPEEIIVQQKIIYNDIEFPIFTENESSLLPNAFNFERKIPFSSFSNEDPYTVTHIDTEHIFRYMKTPNFFYDEDDIVVKDPTHHNMLQRLSSKWVSRAFLTGQMQEPLLLSNPRTVVVNDREYDDYRPTFGESSVLHFMNNYCRFYHTRIQIYKQINKTQYELMDIIFSSYYSFVIHRMLACHLPFDDNSDVTIPIMTDILFKKLSLIDRAEIIAISVRMVAYFYQRIKTKKYKKYLGTILQVVMIGLVIIGTILSGGSLTSGLMAAYQAGIMALLEFISIKVLVAVGVMLALKLIQKEVKNEFLGAFLGAIVATVAMYVNGGFEMPSLDFTTAVGVIDVSLSASTGIIEQKNKKIESEIFDLQKSLAQINESQKKLDELFKSDHDPIDASFLANLNYSPNVSRNTSGQLAFSMTFEQQYYLANEYLYDIHAQLDLSNMTTVDISIGYIPVIYA